MTDVWGIANRINKIIAKVGRLRERGFETTNRKFAFAKRQATIATEDCAKLVGRYEQMRPGATPGGRWAFFWNSGVPTN